LRIEKALLVFRKDWLEIRRNWQVILPIVLLPLIVSVFLPVALTAIPSLAPQQEATLEGFEELVINLPGNVQERLAGMTFAGDGLCYGCLFFFSVLSDYFFDGVKCDCFGQFCRGEGEEDH